MPGQLAPRPELLLLDEPLSALDVRTQEQMRRELAAVIRSEKIPCIIVTHSIVDALAVADRIAVIQKGKIVDTGTPDTIIHNPEHGFVSSFADNMNLFRGTVVVSENGVVCVDVAGIKIRATTTLSGTVSLGIRPEELILSREKFVSSAINSFAGTITGIEDTGLSRYVYVDISIPLAGRHHSPECGTARSSRGDEHHRHVQGDRSSGVCVVRNFIVFFGTYRGNRSRWANTSSAVASRKITCLAGRSPSTTAGIPSSLNPSTTA